MFTGWSGRRVSRLIVVTVIALGAVACGSPNDHNTAKPSTSVSPARPVPPPPPPPPTDYVEGMISTFEGNTITLRTREGTATVDFSPTTEIIETTPGQAGDVTVGSCVDVRPTPQSAPGAVTAQSVTVSPAVEGNCPPPAPEPGPAGVTGKVDSVADNVITVAGAPQTKVTVIDATTYAKAAPADTEALTQGKCLSADGTKDSSGALQAAMIDLQPCPPMGHPRHRLHLPFHLPHRHHHG